MIKGSTTRKQAFFDPLDTPAKPFWRQSTPGYFSNMTVILEESFYMKENESSNQWQNCVLCLYKDYLVCKSKKGATTVTYMNLEENFHKLEVIKVAKKKGDSKDLTGFAIARNGKRTEFLCKKAATFLRWRNELAKYCLMTDFHDNYRTLKVLGSGGYGKVFLIEETVMKTKWAGKFIKVSPQKNKEKQLLMIKNEILALKKLDHPHIVKLYEMYEMEDEICLVLEYVYGERLFDEIVKRKGIPETETAILMKQLFSILSYLEYKDIIHRDLKPENILLIKDSKGQMKMKLIDFGLAAFNSNRDSIKKGGTAGYAAPEILNNESYSFKVDLYSAGVVMFTCLTGKPLFSGANYNDLLERNRKGTIKYTSKPWTKMSLKSKELLQSILEPNPTRRTTLDKVISHPWFVSMLTPEDHQELLANTLKFGQMEIPKESTIAKVPGSFEVNNSQFIKVPSHNDFGSHHTSGSATWLTSQYALESANYMINSFYKLQSSQSILTDRSQNDQDGDAQTNDPKSNVLSIPNQKAIGQKSSTLGSLASINLEIGKHRFEGYNIKIHTIGGGDSFPELEDIANDEEEEPCSVKYARLPEQDMFFDQISFANPQVLTPLVQKAPKTKSLLNAKASSHNVIDLLIAANQA